MCLIVCCNVHDAFLGALVKSRRATVSIVMFVRPSVCMEQLEKYSRKMIFECSEIIPTRCNNCVYSSQWLYSTCFGWQFHPSSCWIYFTIKHDARNHQY